MGIRNKDLEKSYFCALTERERACFEAGIALGSIFHQFIGLPVIADRAYLSRVENMIEETASLQPYRSKVRVRIKSKRVKENQGLYGYATLGEKDVELYVEITYRRAKVEARMKYFEELKYPLMYIESIKS